MQRKNNIRLTFNNKVSFPYGLTLMKRKNCNNAMTMETGLKFKERLV